MLIVLAGLPGSGKTTLARELARRLGAVHLRIDSIEQAIRGSASTDIGATGYEAACAVAADNLRGGLAVVADAVNAVEPAREGWRRVARAAGRPLLWVHVTCTDAREHERRVRQRSTDIPGLALPPWEAVAARAFEAMPAQALVVDTCELAPSDAAARVVEHVAQLDAGAAVATTPDGAPVRVETPRLVLRLFTPADHPAYARICADPEVMRYIGAGQPNSPEVTWRSMAGMRGHWDLLGYGLWALCLRDGPLIGHVGFIDVPGWPGFELAWLLGREHWGQGHAREAAAAALRIAHETLRRERVISLIRPGNGPSIRLARALGATREGVVELMGSPAELYVHSMPQRPAERA